MFRVESYPDIIEFQRLFYNNIQVIEIDNAISSHMFVSLNSDATIDEIKACFRKIPNSDIMIETIALCKNYTGERDYSVE